jgi:hypothetical protein
MALRICLKGTTVSEKPADFFFKVEESVNILIQSDNSSPLRPGSTLKSARIPWAVPPNHYSLAVTLTTHLHLIPSIECVELYLHYSIRLHGVVLNDQAQGQYYTFVPMLVGNLGCYMISVFVICCQVVLLI